MTKALQVMFLLASTAAQGLLWTASSSEPQRVPFVGTTGNAILMSWRCMSDAFQFSFIDSPVFTALSCPFP